MGSGTTYVALLRGINVGKAKRVAMADLRAVIESLGYRKARTLLNSGNAVFESPRALRKGAAEALQAALVKKTGVSSRFILRSGAELADVYASNSLARQATDHTRLFALFLADSTVPPTVKALWQQPWEQEWVAAGPGVIYVWCPNGLLESRAMEALGKALGDGVTVRNWATVTKLIALMERDA